MLAHTNTDLSWRRQRNPLQARRARRRPRQTRRTEELPLLLERCGSPPSQPGTKHHTSRTYFFFLRPCGFAGVVGLAATLDLTADVSNIFSHHALVASRPGRRTQYLSLSPLSLTLPALRLEELLSGQKKNSPTWGTMMRKHNVPEFSPYGALCAVKR